ncbi:50S ribosomal protein L4 [Candidatus Desulforudis audaxviator]|uniref:Large ribosomal subunit protein uL4 n=1 Tax=Desulforudis audaxviator (strain MP104C) TaxID=477974 RepID=RL4_DESAP|nr:50S ribosomal protein L4 [Candidatus Desulforudis audaxviator]B1I1I9.1 RecName: Full=Large ribosomal subunit protein uL4; AltName: Full=50S ribosomal protein L4 [Candidatus Desulforudis audaxviator MP104C]ACA58787.1 ribosomal protein L4/L1e [Candidatus Desulforudis audaxviator MP104C]AZK58799.1 LSU ribosomal protein L4p (L1e) [Candidatus Desulforudis audaxviator]
MPTAAVFNIEGQQVGEIELSEAVFGQPVNDAVLHEVVVMQLANRRQGTHDTKTRSEVRGGGRKPWRQKGTGRARHGTIRSPIWRGGGIVFGPHPRDYSYRVPKKVKRLALKSALATKVDAGRILVLDALELPGPKTKEMARILANLKAGEGALVVTAERNVNVEKSARNLPGVKSLEARQLNVYDLLNHPHLIITRDAVARVEEVLA